jgi:hypothetical protein
MTLSKLQQLSIRVVTSQTKLLFIMHVDKVSVENEKIFQLNFESLLKPPTIEIH